MKQIADLFPFPHSIHRESDLLREELERHLKRNFVTWPTTVDSLEPNQKGVIREITVRTTTRSDVMTIRAEFTLVAYSNEDQVFRAAYNGLGTSKGIKLEIDWRGDTWVLDTCDPDSTELPGDRAFGHLWDNLKLWLIQATLFHLASTNALASA